MRSASVLACCLGLEEHCVYSSRTSSQDKITCGADGARRQGQYGAFVRLAKPQLVPSAIGHLSQLANAIVNLAEGIKDESKDMHRSSKHS
ncbi:unnamed protein product [Calypogeia fissa]